VGDCALHLGDALWKIYGIASDFLVYNPPRPEATLEMQPFPHAIERLDGRGAEALNAALDRLLASSSVPPTLLLHYVSYGYAPGGIVTWMPGAIERFRKRGGRLVSLFHEIYAMGRFPSRTYFASWPQRRVFRSLLAQSDAAFASSQDFLKRMERENRGPGTVAMIGICSNVGEPEHPAPLAARKRRIAIFGQFFTRKRIYERYLPLLQQVAEHFSIEEIADIGLVQDEELMDQRVRGSLGGMLRVYGRLPAAETSALLEDSLIGAVSYPYAMRWKSGVVAAYQAHALAILLFPYEGEAGPNEPHGPDSWCFSADQLLLLPTNALKELQLAASSAHNHYQRFRSSRSMAETLLPALVTKR
jgi:hypothetical protein